MTRSALVVRQRWLIVALVVGAFALVANGCVYPTTGKIATLVGSVGIGSPLAFAMDVQGVAIHGTDVYVADGALSGVVRRINRTTGAMSVVAGTKAGNAVAPSPSARADQLALNTLSGVAVDPNGLPVLAADDRIYRVNADGTRHQVTPTLIDPSAMAHSAAGIAYVEGPAFSDPDSGPTSTSVGLVDFAGTASVKFTYSHPAGQALHLRPIAIGDDATIYAVSEQRRIHRVDPGNTLALVAETSSDITSMVADGDALIVATAGGLARMTPDGSFTDLSGPGTPLEPHAGRVNHLVSMGLDADGTIAAAQWGPGMASPLVVVIDPDAGSVETIAGTGLPFSDGSGMGGPAAHAIVTPLDVAVAPDGSYIAATSTGLLRFTKGGPIEAQNFTDPVRSVAFGPSGALYFSIYNKVLVRQPDGTITVVVNSSGLLGSTGDGGPAVSALVREPRGLTVDADGDLYFADSLNNKVRRVSAADGTITTFAGTGSSGFAGDGGQAATAKLFEPWSVTAAPDGRVFIADTKNHRVRVVDGGGTITTFAGGTNPTASTSASIGDGGPAVGATLARPTDVVVRGTDVYVSNKSAGLITCAFNVCLSFDTNADNRIRRVDGNGTITTLAGLGRGGSMIGDGGPAAQAGLNQPYGLGLHGNGVLIADTINNRVRVVYV